MEVMARGESVSLTHGGVEADSEVVRGGKIAHMRTGRENRWCVLPHLVQLQAFWFSHAAFSWNSASCFGLEGWYPEQELALSDPIHAPSR